MANYNKVQLIGNLTRDPEVRYTPKGTAVVDIGLAVNRTWKDDSGQKQEETTFVDITFFGRTAEVIGEYSSKGKSVFVEGRLKLDTWEDNQTGQNRSKLKVVGDQIQFLSPRSADDATRTNGPPANTNYDRAQAQVQQGQGQNYPPSGGHGQPYPSGEDDLPM
jgi:single-strand DNA-binding protein